MQEYDDGSRGLSYPQKRDLIRFPTMSGPDFVYYFDYFAELMVRKVDVMGQRFNDLELSFVACFLEESRTRREVIKGSKVNLVPPKYLITPEHKNMYLRSLGAQPR